MEVQVLLVHTLVEIKHGMVVKYQIVSNLKKLLINYSQIEIVLDYAVIFVTKNPVFSGGVL